MRYVHELSAALSLLLLLLIPVPLLRLPKVVKWLAAFGMMAILLSGLLVRGFTGKDPLDLAGEYLVDGICSARDFGACRTRRAKVEEEAKEQARLKAAEDERREQARLKAAEDERRERARLKAAEDERREQARLKAAEDERREQARQKAAEDERREQARQKAAEEQRRQKEAEQKARTYRQRPTNAASPSPPKSPSSGGCPGWMFVGQTCTRSDGKVCTQQPGYNKRTCE